ncbi:hypothetical protein EDB86DRAFT_2830153, partial [Lactarius hatsudake]
SSADGLTTNNQTNLAIKGIIAVEAMSKMSSIVKRTADADKYSNIAARLYSQWRSLALDSDQHLLAVYRQEGSWTLGYNLFADVWLDTGVVESSVFNGQSSFVDNLALTSSFSWNLFVAAMSSNQDLRTNLISRVHNRASFNTSAGVFPLSYDSTHGSTILGGARIVALLFSPAQGAIAPVVQITINGTVSSSSTSTSHTGAIAGGVAGGVVALILVVGAIAFVRRRRRQDNFRGSSFSAPLWKRAADKGDAVRPNTRRVALLEAGSRAGQRCDTRPCGLSSKELARLRSTAMRSQPTHTWSSPSGSQPSNPPTTISTAERSSTTTPPPETRRLQTEMETLRREVEEYVREIRSAAELWCSREVGRAREGAGKCVCKYMQAIGRILVQKAGYESIIGSRGGPAANDLLANFPFLPFHSGRAQQTFFPAAIPLAVRSPYLSCWDHTTNGTNLGNLWPTTSDPSQILGWSVLVRIDRLTYSFLGSVPGGNGGPLNGTVNFTDTVITPTQTVIAAQAGPMQVNLTFLNPIEPGDWVKQSIPFSYLALSAKSLDGAAHAVQVYSDVSGEWNSGDRGQMLRWSTTSTSDVVYHTVNLQNPAVFNEINNMAEWGSFYYAMKSANGLTFKIAQDSISRTFFVQNGSLDNQTDPVFRAINDKFAVFAISRDLGTIQATADPVVWTVGLTMDQVINYTDISGAAPRPRSLFYKTQYSNDTSLSSKLDQKILQCAAPVSGPTRILDRKTNRVNAVETLYSAFPAFVYIDPTLGRHLLEPMFQAPSIFQLHHPPHKADTPNETGQYSLMTSWADYLSNFTLVIHDQSSADGLLTTNQTNLAIKGIIAIEAMSKMSSVVKQTADADKYSNIAASLYNQWRSLALDSDQHLLAVYGQEGSWTLGYNLFADVWLDTGVVGSSVFNGQSSFVDNLALTSDFSWNLFVAAMSSNQDLRTNLISRVHNRASLTYDSTHGSTILGGASPAQGAIAPVAQITVNPTTSTATTSKAASHTGAIAGGVAGGFAGLILVAAAIALIRRRRRQDNFGNSPRTSFSGSLMNVGPHMTVTPFIPTLAGAAPLDAGSQFGTKSDGPSSTSESPLPPLQGVAPILVGLTSKELARMRSAADRFPLAGHARTSSNGSQPVYPSTISTTERSSTATPTPETRRLQSEVKILRREMQELRAERFEAPPSYGEGAGL